MIDMLIAVSALLIGGQLSVVADQWFAGDRTTFLCINGTKASLFLSPVLPPVFLLCSEINSRESNSWIVVKTVGKSVSQFIVHKTFFFFFFFWAIQSKDSSDLSISTESIDNIEYSSKLTSNSLFLVSQDENQSSLCLIYIRVSCRDLITFNLSSICLSRPSRG